MSYYTSTTAGESTAGGVAGYLNQTGLQRGETGTSILQSTTQYFQHTGGGATVNPVATSTVYRNTDGTGGRDDQLQLHLVLQLDACGVDDGQQAGRVVHAEWPWYSRH